MAFYNATDHAMRLARIAGMDAETLINRALSWRMFIGGALLLALILSGIGTVMAWAPNAVEAKNEVVVAGNVPVRTDVEVPTIHTCVECGVIESLRTIVREDDAPAHDAEIPVTVDGLSGVRRSAVSVSEVTVRMNDGTSRQFEDASLSNWRTGERMILIEGVSPSNR